ncbi:hypothetical protein CKO38_11215 [Rhodospirillum rubrum]|uniref:hypothetical protein n=1 Tax=Rhodospirillum rubrum TaxID=1085 RepID=UPI00190481CE|nr:hypothetical protein [Rhodospirillum rubrum]MBK1664957.1 hypothetical protein [Rhodospirillum rubrum]MBK1677223.1 hypothetical protein [Rhodospirillum rubrum]
MIRKVLVLAALIGAPLLMPGAAWAAEKCDTVGVYGAIALVVCPQVNDPPALERAGREACAPINVRGVCNAWIWNKADRAARALPMTDRQLGAVTALWVNKQNTLKVCARDGCYGGQTRKTGKK